MQWLLRKCVVCGRYTLAKDRCPYCGGPLRVPHPPRFSPDDKYVKYRYLLREGRLSREPPQPSLGSGPFRPLA